ncbi:hypothetical protein VTH06DRAFT_1475 [Thermothelomyces fergusii]
MAPSLLRFTITLLMSTAMARSDDEQMYAQGAAFRNRYLCRSGYDEYVGIVGIDPEHINTAQLRVESSTDPCSSASALAFMQGLYPPNPHVACDSDVPHHHWLPNGSILNYPLNGYQYPNIRTLAPDRDPDSIWSHGHVHCSKHEGSIAMFADDSMVDSIYQGSKAFYSSLWDKVFSRAFPRSQTNFYNAHELYDYAAYHWNHGNGTSSAITSDDLEALRHLAWEEQSLKYGQSDSGHKDPSAAIAGRTLASRVASIFVENMESRGERNKLSLAFTTHEPFLSFFALTNLTTGPSGHLFSQLPNPGATLTFELFSVDEPAGSNDAGLPKADAHYRDDHCSKTSQCYNRRARCESCETGAMPTCDARNTSASNHSQPFPSQTFTNRDNRTITPSFPDLDHLYVRCLYQNPDRYNDSIKTGNSTRELTPCPLFDSKHGAVPFKHFKAIVSSIGIPDTASWCSACESGDTVFFCKGAEPRTEKQHHHMLAALAGSAGTLLAVSLIGFLE